MADNSVLLRCTACRTVNRVPAHKLNDTPRCGKCKVLLEFPRGPVEVNAANFRREIMEWPGVALVEFWSSRCGVCRSVAPAVRELAHLRAGSLKVATINADQEHSLSGQFNIRAVPTFILYRHGEKIKELTGGLSTQQLEEWINASLASYRYAGSV
ncbi:MAG TPA: thioredoxin domain-containing protein [Dissulfurispiraceae bacterium]